jgi:hypothetical protein
MKTLVGGTVVLVGVLLLGCASTSRIDWTPENAAHIFVTSQRSVILRKAPVLLVIHPSEEDQWQFLAGQEPPTDPSVMVPLEQVLQIDSSLVHLFDLPVGWKAFRVNIGEQWQRSPM